MIDIIEKARRVIHSCTTTKQAKAAERYLNLVSERFPHLDIWELRKELNTLFSASVYESV